MNSDSVAIDTSKEVSSSTSNLKLLLVLFVLFIFVVSDVFVNGVLSSFGEKAVVNRDVTAWGVVLQGIFLVVFYAIATHLSNEKII